MEFDTFVNVALEFVPIALTAARQTMTIKASITAYSTAVGPSSDLMNLCALLISERMILSRMDSLQ